MAMHKPQIPACPLEKQSSLLGGKWKIRLLWAVHEAGSARFSALKRELAGITDMALASCLKDFVACGVMRREQFNEVPPHVEYSLTEQGRSLIDSLEAVRQWSRRQPG